MLNLLVKNLWPVYLLFYFMVAFSYAAPLQTLFLTEVFRLDPHAAKNLVAAGKIPVWFLTEIVALFVFLASIRALKIQHFGWVKRGIIIITWVVSLLYLSLIILFLIFQGRSPSGLLG